MNGSPSQIEWAERIRVKVGEEFDRLADLFRSVGLKQTPEKRKKTDAVLSILEEKRHDVMRRQEAGYFIREWQEINDQVQKLIRRDARFQDL